MYLTHHRVRFGDVDPAGIVYYPVLVHYTHLAIEDVFRDHLGLDYAALLDEHRLGLPTVRVEMDFRRPLRFGDDLEIATTVAELGESSVVWQHALHRTGTPEPVAEARLVTVCVDLTTFEKRALPTWLRRLLTPPAED